MSTTQVESALVKAFVDTGLFPLSNLQTDNVDFVPPQGEAWAALHFLPNPRDVASLGINGDDQLTGVFQIDLNYPLNTGRADASAMADILENAFTAGRHFAYSGQTVAVLSCGRSQGQALNGSFRVVVSVIFRALIPRASAWEPSFIASLNW
jgi:hypothetical protein